MTLSPAPPTFRIVPVGKKKFVAGKLTAAGAGVCGAKAAATNTQRVPDAPAAVELKVVLPAARLVTKAPWVMVVPSFEVQKLPAPPPAPFTIDVPEVALEVMGPLTPRR